MDEKNLIFISIFIIIIFNSYFSLAAPYGSGPYGTGIYGVGYTPPARTSAVSTTGGGGATCSYDWVCSEWYPSPCPSNGIQQRVCVNRGTCSGTSGIPELNRTCIPEVISPTEPLFDIFVGIPGEYKWVIQTNQIKLNLQLNNVGNATTIDVSFKYWIVDENGRLIGEKQETRAVSERDTFQIAMPVPENLPVGIYKIYVQITYGNNKIAIAEDSFEVVKTEFDILLRQATSFPYVLAPFVLIIVILTLIILIRKKRIQRYEPELTEEKVSHRKLKRHRLRKKIRHRKIKKKIIPARKKKEKIMLDMKEKRAKLEEKQRKKMIENIRKEKIRKK